MARIIVPMVRRVIAVGLVSMFALLAVSPWLACGGWQASAAARHACCVTMGCSHSGSTSDTDACCAQKESTSHQSQAERTHIDGTIALVPTALAGSFDAWRFPDSQTFGHHFVLLPPHAENSLYLQFALLRI